MSHNIILKATLQIGYYTLQISNDSQISDLAKLMQGSV